MAQLFVSHNGKDYRHLGNKRDYLELYLEKGKLTLPATDSISKIIYTGTPLNKELAKYNEALKPARDSFNKLNAYYKAAAPEKQKSDEFQKEVSAKQELIQEQRKQAQLKFIKRYPASLLSLYAIKDLAGPVPQVEEVAPLYESLSGNLKETAEGKKYGLYLVKLSASAIGKTAPEIVLPDTAGKIIKLSSFKGKYVLIDFWASWCGPCRAENPAVVKAYEKYKTKGFEILGVSLDKESAKGAWIQAIHDDKLTWPQVSDLKYWKSEVVDQYSVAAIPQNFLLDPAGKIIAKNLRGRELEKKLAEVFGVM